MATATFRSGTIRSIGRSNQSGNSIEKKLALKSRVTACKSAKKREKNYWTTTTKKKEAHAVTVKLRQLRTTWRTSGPFELVRQRHIFSKFLFFSYFEMFGVGSFCLLPSPEEKKKFRRYNFFCCYFSLALLHLFYLIFFTFFLAALKNGTLCKGGGFHKTAGNPPHFEEPTPPPPPGPQKIQNERQKKIIFIKSNQTTHRNRWRRGSKNLKGNWKRINR